MFFSSKVECDSCNAKIAKTGALYHRGSFFCNVEHLQEWERRNPPKMASGDPAELKAKLVTVIERFGFGAPMPHVVEALQRARWRATQP